MGSRFLIFCSTTGLSRRLNRHSHDFVKGTADLVTDLNQRRERQAGLLALDHRTDQILALARLHVSNRLTGLMLLLVNAAQDLGKSLYRPGSLDGLGGRAYRQAGTQALQLLHLCQHLRLHLTDGTHCMGSLIRDGYALFAHAVEAITQGSGGYTQLFGSAGTVAAALHEGVDDVLVLGTLAAGTQRILAALCTRLQICHRHALRRFQPQVAGLNEQSLAQYQRPLNGVFQLPHVARPAVDSEGLTGLGGQQLLSALVRSVLADELVGERNDVLHALAQGQDV